MNSLPGPRSLPSANQSFKGIALFTPGGDVVYCIDPQKRDRWHLQLCAVLQDRLNLAEPPHFLVPCYSATIDCWLDPQTHILQVSAEACPLVLRHQTLLNALFGTDGLTWIAVPAGSGVCDRLVLSTYQQQFPQLWQHHNLVVRFEASISPAEAEQKAQPDPKRIASTETFPAQGYVLRLYVSGNSNVTERILQNLHHLLEEALQQPYTLKLVDIHKHPEQAEADQIAATPTLLRVWPQPTRRLVGDLENLSQVLQLLGVSDAHTLHDPEGYGN